MNFYTDLNSHEYYLFSIWTENQSFTLILGGPVTCLPHYFKCHHDDICIPEHLRCDGIGQCGDDSDELECSAKGWFSSSLNLPVVFYLM